MSVKTPLNPTLTLKGIDLKVQDIRPSLSWLQMSFGLADRIVDKEDFTYPAIFESNKIDPISMMPCDMWKSFAFWVKEPQADVENNINFPPRNPIVTYKVSCIFYMDINRTHVGSSYKEAKTNIRYDIFNFFNKVKLAGQLVLTEVIEDDITKIYEGFSLEQMDNKYKMYPRWAIRLNFDLSYRDSCTATTTTVSWTDPVYILTSGSIWYKRTITSTTFTLSYSSDAGVTYTELMNLDITEDSVVIDLTHQYVHSIVGTSYQVATTLGEVLYST